MSDSKASATKDMTYNENENSIYIYNNREVNSLEYSLSMMQEYLRTSSHLICYDLKLSHDSSSNIPYMADNLFINMIGTSTLVCDFITIDMSSYRSKVMLQYRSKNKFEGLLNKVKAEMYRDIGIKAAVEHEFKEQKVSEVKVSSYYNVSTNLLNKTRTKLLIHLDPYVSDDQLSSQIETIIGSNIIDGIIVGGWSKEKNYFISGELNRVKSLELLKKVNLLAKGRIPIISTGGILNGKDVFDRLSNGASLVLLHSAFLLRGPYCLELILSELDEKMKNHNKLSIDSLKH
jgi:dihydroorotate dehydrogenase